MCIYTKTQEDKESQVMQGLNRRSLLNVSRHWVAVILPVTECA